jgi:hypothetical protein
VPSSLIERLRQDAARYDTALRVAATDQARAVLAAITEMAANVERRDSAYVQELRAWAPPPGSTRLDGVPASAYPAHAELTSPNFPARDFALGRGWGLPYSTRISRARFTGVVCILTTPVDSPPPGWARARRFSAFCSHPRCAAWLLQYTASPPRSPGCARISARSSATAATRSSSCGLERPSRTR